MKKSVLLLVMVIAVATETAVPQGPLTPPSAPALTGEKAIQHLKDTGQYESLGAAITGARYGVKSGPSREHATAANPAHGLFSTFTPDGLRLEIRGGESPVRTVTWRLASLGYGTSQVAVPAGELKVDGQRAKLIRGAALRPGSAMRVPQLVEWFENKPGGLEHGFTLAGRPGQNAAGEPLRLVMAVTGDLAPHADDSGLSLSLRDAGGRTVLAYNKLKVWDATGVELPATMRTDGDRVILAVNEAAARYPLTIDPTFVQQGYLKGSNSEGSDQFGFAVAVSGDTVVVGATFESSNATGVNGNQSDNSGTNSGAAYVFGRNAFVPSLWEQLAYLKASNTEANDFFGTSVAVSGGTVIVGAPEEDSNAFGVNGPNNNFAPGSGAAYRFVRGGSPFFAWSQQAYIKSSDARADDGFGTSVSASGSTVVVGADTANTTYVFDFTAPEIAVEQPVGGDLPDGSSQDFVVISSGNSDLTFTLKNIGNENLTGLTITQDGTDAALFTVTANPTAPVVPGGSTTFTVRFAPTSGGAKTAALHIASNDANENPFDLTLNGYTLTFTQDTDGDGLNDATEF